MRRSVSGVAALLAPQAELFLHRAVGVAEQHGLVLGMVADRHPARRDEDVARLPAEDLVADPALAGTLDRDIDRPVGRAVGAGRKALRQQLDEGADRRHRIVAARRVDVAHLVPVIGVGLAVAAQGFERLAGARIGIVEDRRGLDLGLPIDRQQIIAEPRGAVAFRPRHRLHLGGGLLGKARAQQFDDLDVEPVEPDHRLLRLVAVIVPGPGGGDDEIAGLHRGALAVDGGIGAVTLDDEAQRRLRMTMGRRDFAGQDQLQPGKQRAGDRGLPLQSRIFQDQDAALSLLRRDQPAGLHQMRPDLLIAPQRRDARRGRLGGDERMQLLPERRQVGGSDPLVKGLAFGCGHSYAAIERGRSPSVKPSLARSAISAEDCAWSSGTSGGRTAAQSGSLWKCATMRFSAGTIG